MAERCFEISKNIFVNVNDTHRFGTDAVLLADFAAPKSRDVACDMGTGCGIIPFFCKCPAEIIECFQPGWLRYAA